MEQLLAQFVFPEFSSPHGHLRARACWVLQHFCNIKFNEETILGEAINLTQRALLTDSDLPVKVRLISIASYLAKCFYICCGFLLSVRWKPLLHFRCY